MILHEIGIATRLGVPRETLKALRRSGQLLARRDYTTEKKTLLYTEPGAARLLVLLRLPPDALDEKTAPPASPVSSAGPSEALPEKNAAPVTVWTFLRLNPLNWTQCTARAGDRVQMVYHAWPEAEARRLRAGKDTLTCRFANGSWRRVPGLDRCPPLKPSL